MMAWLCFSLLVWNYSLPLITVPDRWVTCLHNHTQNVHQAWEPGSSIYSALPKMSTRVTQGTSIQLDSSPSDPINHRETMFLLTTYSSATRLRLSATCSEESRLHLPTSRYPPEPDPIQQGMMNWAGQLTCSGSYCCLPTIIASARTPLFPTSLCRHKHVRPWVPNLWSRGSMQPFSSYCATLCRLQYAFSLPKSLLKH